MADTDAMIRGILTSLTFVSVVLFPWPLAAVLALASAWVEPFVPLAAGLFADTLYYAPQTGGLPLATLLGAVATAIAFFVRSRLATGSMGR